MKEAEEEDIVQKILSYRPTGHANMRVKHLRVQSYHLNGTVESPVKKLEEEQEGRTKNGRRKEKNVGDINVVTIDSTTPIVLTQCVLMEYVTTTTQGQIRQNATDAKHVADTHMRRI